MWDKVFRDYKKLQIASRIAAVIVNGEIDKKISGYSSKITNAVDNNNSFVIMELN